MKSQLLARFTQLCNLSINQRLQIFKYNAKNAFSSLKKILLTSRILSRTSIKLDVLKV